MLQFHKTFHAHEIVVHPGHLPLLRLPGGTYRARGREKQSQRGHYSQIGHLRRKGRKARERAQRIEKKKKGAGQEKTADLRLQSVWEEVGGERKWK